MILSYIRLNIKTLLMFLLFTAVFGSMTYVYGLPAEAVGYAFLLCLVISAVAVTADFLKFRAKHRALQQFAEQVSFSISNMPASSNLIESDYCEIIKLLNTSKGAGIKADRAVFSPYRLLYTVGSSDKNTYCGDASGACGQ